MSELNKQIITAVINTLNQIEIHGENNLNMMLGSIQALKSLLKDGENDG